MKGKENGGRLDKATQRSWDQGEEEQCERRNQGEECQNELRSEEDEEQQEWVNE